MCVYVYMCLYLYDYKCVYVCTCECTFMYECVYECTCVHTCFVNVCMCVLLCV